MKNCSNNEGISQLVSFESKRMIENCRSLRLLDGNRTDKFGCSGKIVKGEDFEKLSGKLDREVKSGENQSKHCLLEEGNRAVFCLRKGRVGYFKIHCRGKIPPLRIVVNRKYGKVIVCVSRRIEFPTEKSCVRVFKSDIIQYSPKKNRLLTEFIYVSVSAVEDSEFSIIPGFYRGKGLSLPKRNNSQDIMLKENPRNHGYCEKPDIQTMANTPKCKKRNRFSDIWNLRKSRALRQKTLLLNEKKQKALILLSRNSETHNNKNIHKEYIEDLQRKQRMWLTLIVFNECINSLRAKIQEIHPQSEAFVTDKRLTKSYQVRNISLQRANVLLKFYNSKTYFIYKRSINIRISSAIKQSAEDTKFIYTVNSFFIRLKSIPSKWRHSIQNSKEQLASLKTHWDQTLSYLSIKNKLYKLLTLTERDFTLKEYLSERQQEYSKTLQDYLESTNYMKRVITGKFLAAINQPTQVVKQGVPSFHYKLTTESMIDLINQTLFN